MTLTLENNLDFEITNFIKMAHRTMPILYLNLCGEMLYIIDQRLIDTKTDPEKQIKGTYII